VVRNLRRLLHSQRGFTLLEVIVAAALLSVIAAGVTGGLLFGLKEASQGKYRGAAAGWLEAELDFLRLQGYTNLGGYVALGNRVLTVPTDPDYTTYGSLQEPRIPAGFDRAEVQVTDIVTPALRKITVKIYRTPGATPLATAVTYVATVTTP
jgi:prepilin-type N-terminal cleavage/methylation domain-containing protein